MARQYEPQTSSTRFRRALALLGSAVFLVIAPGFIAGLVPYWISRWQLEPPFLGFRPFRVIGVLLMIAATPVLLESFGRFALKGLGTPAPVFPPQHLIVTGFYRYVRNPMYVAVISVVFGQALLLGDLRLLGYSVFVALAMHLFVLAYEEPTLRRSFGIEYENYRANVRRWFPRLTPWPGATE
jgi:protein-S-isoprenylcysteine O-methyltransferase Ste14